jgi:hypothetical protein
MSRRGSIGLGKTLSPREDSEFSLHLPSVVAPNSSKDFAELQNQHKHAFGDEESEFRPLSAEELKQPYIEQRKINLAQAEELLAAFRPKAPFFPFIRIPAHATVPSLSRDSPFLLLAILTIASSKDAVLAHQMDHEFRRILSSKVIVEGQKSLDFLQGMLLYIAW